MVLIRSPESEASGGTAGATGLFCNCDQDALEWDLLPGVGQRLPGNLDQPAAAGNLHVGHLQVSDIRIMIGLFALATNSPPDESVVCVLMYTTMRAGMSLTFVTMGENRGGGDRLHEARITLASTGMRPCPSGSTRTGFRSSSAISG
jgi:hypothetical protein